MRKTGTRPVSILTGQKNRDNSKTRRLFFAIDLPEQVISNAERLISGFDISPSHVRWVRFSNLHITLKFLGDVNVEMIPAIANCARKAAIKSEPLKLTIQGMGLFPNMHKPQIVWFGVGGENHKLSMLEAELSEHLELLGIPGDERPFKAHLTIGRVKSKNARGGLIRLTHNNHDTYVGEAMINSLVLYESQLDPGGAIYTKLESFDL